MINKYYAFCDESCHQFKNDSDVMAIGGVLCNYSKYEIIKNDLKQIKTKYNHSFREIKWSRLSLKNLEMYKDIVDYFFNSPNLSFHGVVLKNRLLYEKTLGTQQIYDESYYFIYSILIIKMSSVEDAEFSVFIDRRDNQTTKRIKKIYDVLTKNQKVSPYSIERIESVDSKCNLLIQLADLFTGFLTYVYRGKNNNANADRCKSEMVKHIKMRIEETRQNLASLNKFSILSIPGVKK